MTPSRDTIYALASGQPPAGLAVLRISGPDVSDIAMILLSRGLPKARHASLDSVLSAEGETIDEAVAIYFAGPSSYTGDDTLELSLHGGRIIIEKVFTRLSEIGARLALPGEFTRRAFENGKLDLTRAEAIADLIDAETEAQHRQAMQQFGGALARLYSGWYDDLLAIRALLEASIDFPDEEDAPDRIDGPVKQKLAQLTNSLRSALKSGHISERIRDGFKVAILGAPNAGKSSLLNALAGREAAIVTDIPGTTRDRIEVRLHIGGYLVWLIDTAGLRETEDLVEAEGVRRARQARQEADLNIWLYDAVAGPFPFSDEARSDDLVVANKIDLGLPNPVSRETLALSAKDGTGLSDLIAAIETRLGGLGRSAGAPLLTRARHRHAIEAALSDLARASEGLETGVGAELVAVDVQSASQKLVSLTGQVETEAVLGAVFSQFCIGK